MPSQSTSPRQIYRAISHLEDWNVHWLVHINIYNEDVCNANAKDRFCRANPRIRPDRVQQDAQSPIALLIKYCSLNTLSLFYKRRSIRDGRQIFEKYKGRGLGFSKKLRDNV